MSGINRIDYYNKEKQTDFEMLDIQYFFATRPKGHLEKDFRLNFWVIIYITEGSGSHFIDFQKYDYKVGDILFIHMNQVHHFVINDQVKGYLFHINDPFFYAVENIDHELFGTIVDETYGKPKSTIDNSEKTTNRVLADLIYKEYNKPLESMDIRLIGSLFRSFVLSLRDQLKREGSAHLSKDYEHFTIFRKLVDDHYMETRNVEEYADMMHLSKKTVNQAVRKAADMSAKGYIIDRTILEIKRYLSQGELMNYEIADLVGFDEAANMTRFFKKYEGISPKPFRESIKERN